MWLFVYHFYVVLLLGIMKTYQAIAIVQLLLYPSTNTPGTHIIHINYHNEVWIRETKAYEHFEWNLFHKHGSHSGCTAFHSEVCHKAKQFFVVSCCRCSCSCSVCIHTFCVEKLDMNMIVHCLLCQREWTRCCFAVSCTPAMYEYKRIGHAKKVVEYLSMMLYGGHWYRLTTWLNKSVDTTTTNIS